MKQQKGFTLIELLAVIVILAIITLITMPLILGVIEKTRVGAAERTIDNYIHAIELSVAEKMVTEGFDATDCTIQSDRNLLCGESVLEVKSKGEKPSSGTIKLKDGMVNQYKFILNEKEYTNITPERCFQSESNEDGNAIIVDYLCEEEFKNIIIPNIINGQKVVGIGKDAFSNNHLVSIILPDSVTNIGQSAFWGNQLKSVIIPDSVITIGRTVFYANALINLTIGRNVESIENLAFSSNGLTNVIIPNSVTNIGDNAFAGNQLTDITIGNSVTNIGIFAFSRNQLTSITIPNSVTIIGDSAFSSNRLVSVKINNSPNNITMGSNVFEWGEGYSDSNIEWLN